MTISSRARFALGAVAAATVFCATQVPSASASTSTDCAGSTACFLDARTGAHSTFDRLVFDMSGSVLPTWIASVSTDGSYNTPSGDSKQYTLHGSSYLTLDFANASANAVDGTSLYTTPNPLAVSLSSLKGVQLTSSYEGHTDFGLSLGSYSGYNVFTLTAPNRVVVDVYH